MLALLLFFGGAQAALAVEPTELLKGATGPTGPTGPEGKTGPTGPAGSGGGGGGSYCTATEGAGTVARQVLGLNEEVSGVWSATIMIPSGGLQGQANGVVSLPCEYPGEPASMKLQYKDEAENTLVKAPCLGDTREPDAEPGNLCVERGSGVPKEPADKDAKFVTFDTPFGDEKKSGRNAVCRSRPRTNGYAGCVQN
jgi:hypothetical protein